MNNVFPYIDEGAYYCYGKGNCLHLVRDCEIEHNKLKPIELCVVSFTGKRTSPTSQGTKKHYGTSTPSTFLILEHVFLVPNDI